MSVYEDSGWYEAAGKLEPELHTGHGLSTELVVTRGEEARKRLEELAAHDLLFGEFHFTLFDPCYSHGDDIVKFAIRHHELMETHKETTFPRSSQNQTASSGVEGAHEGTTADKKGGSREPEKLWCPECCTESGKTEYGDCTNNFHKALAESSLSQGANEAPETDTGWPDYKPVSSLSSPPPKSDSSTPTIPVPLSTQPDTHTEKI